MNELAQPKLVIKKSQLGTNSYFNSGSGKYCALGHYLNALNCYPSYGIPSMMVEPRVAWLYISDAVAAVSNAWLTITHANDDKDGPQYDVIVAEFAKHGVEVEFVDA